MAKQYVFLLAVVVLLAGGLFAVDTQVPLGVAVWLPYVVVVLISLWFPVRSQTFLTAAACTVLTLAGLFVSEAGGGPFWIAAVNRLIGILAIWIAAWVGLAARRTVELEEAYRRLKRESEEREKLQEQFLRTQRLESVGVLASGIAHDFNNLLTPILMAAKLLREDRSEEERQHLLSTLQASAERGAEMVRQILAFAGGTDASRSVLRPKLIIQEIKSILEHTIPKSIVVEVSVEDELAPVSGDSTQILQVLMNLCINARDAMPAGGRLTIQAKNVAIGEQQARIHPDARTGRYLSVSVADTGSGIPKEVADRVFDPFFTTKAPGSGTGLGLSTALGIVRSHGGFITIHSETGRGSVFSVFLPAIEEGAAAPAGTQTQEPTNGNGEWVLVVDDEPLILATAKSTLERRGYHVATARDGAEALEVCKRRGEIRAAVVDMMMPGMDGGATMAALEASHPAMRFVASSGLRLAGKAADIVAAGRGAFLPKPYTDEQLLETLAKVLSRESGRS